jgi:hypothetical protein
LLAYYTNFKCSMASADSTQRECDEDGGGATYVMQARFSKFSNTERITPPNCQRNKFL